MASVIERVVAEHSLEARMLWLRRAAAIHAPNYSRYQFAELDKRLEAHIDGLRVAGDEGWTLAQAALDDEDLGPEDFFPVSVLALEATGDRFASIRARVADVPAGVRGVMSALGWVAPKCLKGLAKALLDAAEPLDQVLGLAACAMHRKDPGAFLETAARSAAAPVRARALRTAGELGRHDLIPIVLDAVAAEDEDVRFWSSWSATLLGNQSRGLDALAVFALNAGVWQSRSLQLALQCMDMDRAHDLLTQLTSGSGTERLRVIGAGMIGAVRYVPWLMEQMARPAVARVAGEAFVHVTGVDFNLEQLESASPPEFEEGPTADPADEDVDVPEDAALVWPDPDRVKDWWAKNSARFHSGTRYFMGAPVTREHCIDVLKNGYQRQRILAAHYLCLLDPGTPLFNTSAPAWRQQKLLAN